MSATIENLRLLLESSSPEPLRERISSGCVPLNQLLPDQGFLRGSLVEWLGSEVGSGVSSLALLAAREACQDGRTLVILDRDGQFYPPAAAAWSIDLDNTIVLYPQDAQDESWALDQALRCPHVGAVLSWPQQLTSHTFRRLQLIAERSGCIGMLIRPSTARREPSWADVRVWVSPKPLQRPNTLGNVSWQLSAQILRCRRGVGDSEVTFEINCQTGEARETHRSSMVTPLAGTTAGSHEART